MRQFYRMYNNFEHLYNFGFIPFGLDSTKKIYFAFGYLFCSTDQNNLTDRERERGRQIDWKIASNEVIIR